jgi:hypothetical protein
VSCPKAARCSVFVARRENFKNAREFSHRMVGLYFNHEFGRRPRA